MRIDEVDEQRIHRSQIYESYENNTHPSPAPPFGLRGLGCDIPSKRRKDTMSTTNVKSYKLFADEIIFSADWHIAEKPYKSRPEIHGGASYMLWQLDRYIRERLQSDAKILLILGGDTTDSISNRCSALIELQTYLRRWADMPGLHIAFIAGNHDHDCWVASDEIIAQKIYHLGDGHLLTVETPGDTFVIAGCDACSGSRFRHWLANVPPESNTIVTHQMYEELFKYGPHASLADVPDYVTTVLNGDIHITSKIEAHGKVLLSPGTPYNRRIKESATSGFYSYSSDKNDWEFHPLAARKIFLFSAGTEEEFVDLLENFHLRTADPEEWPEESGMEELLEEVRRPLVDLKYPSGEIVGVAERIRLAADKKAHVFLSPYSVEGDWTIEQPEISEEDISLISCLEEMREEVNNDLVIDTSRLLLEGVSLEESVKQAAITLEIPVEALPAFK